MNWNVQRDGLSGHHLEAYNALLALEEMNQVDKHGNLAWSSKCGKMLDELYLSKVALVQKSDMITSKCNFRGLKAGEELTKILEVESAKLLTGKDSASHHSQQVDKDIDESLKRFEK